MSHHLGKICNIDFPSNKTLRQKFAMPIVHSGADSCKIDRSRFCRMVLKRGCQEGRSSFAKYGEMSVTVAVFCYSQAEEMWHDYICNHLLLCEM